MTLRYLSAVSLVLAIFVVLLPNTTRADSDSTTYFEFQACLPPISGLCKGPVVDTYTWQIPTSPTVASYILCAACGEYGFTVASVSVYLNGSFYETASISFGYPLCQSDGFGFDLGAQANGDVVQGCDGGPLWTGLPNAPTFLPAASEGGSITDIPGPVGGGLTIVSTEPSALILLVIGLTGLALVRRRLA